MRGREWRDGRRVRTLRCSDRKSDGEDEREESESTGMKRIKMLNGWS